MTAQMELITTDDKGPLTMSSREIAELCEKQHKHVLRDIDAMLSQINQPNFGPVDFQAQYQDAKGEWRKEYRLPKDLTMTLITGYRADLRYKVIKRLEELETTLVSPAPVDLTGFPQEVIDMIERTFGINRMLARKVTEIEKTMALIEARREDEELRIARRVHAELSEKAQLLRRGKTAKQIWDAAGLPPRIKGSTKWFGNRLKESGCMLEGRADRGDGSIRLFDPDRAETILRGSLKVAAMQYAAERRGQGRLKLVHN